MVGEMDEELRPDQRRRDVATVGIGHTEVVRYDIVLPWLECPEASDLEHFSI